MEEQPPAWRFYNKCLRSFGRKLVTRYLKCMGKSYGMDIPFVSIGSGQAFYESRTKIFRWILVDPDPTSYENVEGIVPFRSPDYPDALALFKARPSICRDCCLFLNWCEPEGSTYDFDAVCLLKPKGILALVEKFYGMNGAGGGLAFHALMDRALYGEGDYRVVQQTRLRPKKGDCHAMDMRLVWLTRVDQPISASTFSLPTEVESLISHRDQECIVM